MIPRLSGSVSLCDVPPQREARVPLVLGGDLEITLMEAAQRGAVVAGRSD